ncbi:hypothetical protein DM860_011609 [Cuscuta australis]|uniref:Uncharacterized protein n=1 Tax=Cuscuta australis TaxID=267555 RepID=A0A328D5F4_9ASTE|nr:hypothetical protein DM860_011609 [Cuscuta australis]
MVMEHENLPFPNVWRKKEDKSPSYSFPPHSLHLEEIFGLFLKNGHPIPRNLFSKNDYIRGLGFWIPLDAPLQAISGNTTSTWAPPLRPTRVRLSRCSSRRDPSLEGEEDVHLATMNERGLKNISTSKCMDLDPVRASLGTSHRLLDHRPLDVEVAGDMLSLGQHMRSANLPYPYAREAHLFTGYTAWADALRHSHRIVDRNATLSREHLDYDRVLSERDQLKAKNRDLLLKRLEDVDQA